MAPKAKKKKQVHLTPAEFAIMQILWRSERPLQGPEIMAIIDKPVSYTHLDVYKRQHSGAAQQQKYHHGG